MPFKRSMSSLLEKISYPFASDQEKVIKLLNQQGYSRVATCRRFDISAIMDRFEPSITLVHTYSDIPVLGCNYEMLEKAGDIFVVGGTKSIYYGDKKFSGEPGTLEKNCFYHDDQCELKSISTKLGEVIPTTDLLKQLRLY